MVKIMEAKEEMCQLKLEICELRVQLCEMMVKIIEAKEEIKEEVAKGNKSPPVLLVRLVRSRSQRCQFSWHCHGLVM